jgi:cold shock CspA family protein
VTTSTGVVATWDDHGGYGTVRDDDTGAEHFFHCTAIVDGTRTIEVGTPVTFDVVPGRLGRWEAENIEKHPSESRPPER